MFQEHPVEEIGAGQVADLLKTIAIPPCPSVLMALFAEARQDEVDFIKISSLISGDVGLAAAMMKTANSPYFGLRQKVRSVQQATAVLGLKNILSVVSGLSLQKALTPPGFNMDRFWERSNLHAVTCSRLARRLPAVAAEDAYTYGLFHDCGIPLLMQRFPEYRQTLAQANQSPRPLPEMENQAHGTNHVVVGAMLGHNWQLPESVVQAIQFHHDPDVLDAKDGPWSPVVRLLVALSLLADHQVAHFLGYPDEAEWVAHGVAALDYLGFDEEELDEIQQEVADDLAEIRGYRGEA